jgi:predicted dehydrogenase
VIGFGSIGMRHVRLLEGLGVETAVVSRRDVGASKVYSTLNAAISDWQPDYVVVASKTQEHLKDFQALAEAGFDGTVIMEKPLFDHATDLPEHAFKQIFVAYNLRFHPVLQRFKKLLEDTVPYAVHAYVGQYLPDWRPDADYRKSYSAQKAEGGGVLRDLSHELDYLNWILKGWNQLTAAGGHLSNLEIDSDDIFSVLFESHRCPVVSVQLNYLDSTVRREVLALTDQGSIRADLVKGTVEFTDETGKFKTETFECGRDDTYISLHRAALAGDDDFLCSLDQGLDVLRIIDAAETAAVERTWIAA